MSPVQWRVTILYLASCCTLIASTIGPERAIRFLSRQSAPVVETARAAARTVPRAAVAEAAGPVASQAKRQGPRLREYQVPIGFPLSVQLRTPVGSATSSAGDQVDAVLMDAVTQEGVELIPAGSLLHGSVVDAVPASKKNVLGQVTIAFAVVQHVDTRSRAAVRTRGLTIEAQAPELSAGSGRKTKRQPIDVSLPSGHPLVLTLADPLLVFIPDTGGRTR